MSTRTITVAASVGPSPYHGAPQSEEVELTSQQSPPEPTLFYEPQAQDGSAAAAAEPAAVDKAKGDAAVIDLPEARNVPLSPHSHTPSGNSGPPAVVVVPPAASAISLWPRVAARFAASSARLEAWRWRWLFPLYRQVQPLPWLSPVSLISLLVALLYVVVNVAIFIPLLVQMVNGTGTSSRCNDEDGVGRVCAANDTYNAASTLGTIGAINFLLLMLCSNRNSALTILLGISVERAITWHRWIARYTVFILAAHGAGILSAYWYQGVMSSSALDGPGSLNGSGEISLLAGFAIVLTSWRLLRRVLFEAFLRLHWLLFIVFIVFGMIHEGTFIALVAVAAVPWAIDWYLRVKVWRRPVTVLAMRALAADVVRLDFEATDFHYEAGQWLFICIPEVSPLEWHPFSLSSSPHHSSLMVHIRVLGDWTRRLQRLALKRAADAPPLRMYVEGPYGTFELPLSHYHTLLLVSGGIGITPLQSVFNALVHEASLGRAVVHRIRFVWSVREVELVHSIHGARLHASAHPHASGSLPAAFQPDLLSIHQPIPADAGDDAGSRPAPAASALPASLQAAVETSFHLTTGGADMSAEHLANLQAVYGHAFRIGRVDLDDTMRQMKAACAQNGDARVAVLVCGPAALVRDVKKAAVRWTDKACAFDVHTEEFAW